VAARALDQQDQPEPPSDGELPSDGDAVPVGWSSGAALPEGWPGSGSSGM
jgi:hypothetical protein